MVSPKDWEGKDVYFYADSDQRTIATAHYFAAGVAPEANITVHHKPEGTKDAAFSTSLPASLGGDTLSAIQKGRKSGRIPSFLLKKKKWPAISRSSPGYWIFLPLRQQGRATSKGLYRRTSISP